VNGVFTLFAVAAIVGFVHWISVGPVTGPRAIYHIVFRGSVGGLAKGAEVLFNGMEVGSVAAVSLDERDPRQVMATVSLDSGVPIGDDTFVGLEFGTITGVAWIEMRGSDPSPGRLPKGPDGIPILTADEGAMTSLSGKARALIPKLDSMLATNSELHKSLAKFEDFTATLKSNFGRIDQVLGGMENWIGSSDKPGQLADAAKSVRLFADNFNSQIDGMSRGLEQFAGPGLKNIDDIIANARRAVATTELTFKSLGQSSSRSLLQAPQQSSPPLQAPQQSSPPRPPAQQ
jgi:phospholipid/cholesterol/gamma-HCH transport system substrate-binding protein